MKSGGEGAVAGRKGLPIMTEASAWFLTGLYSSTPPDRDSDIRSGVKDVGYGAALQLRATTPVASPGHVEDGFVRQEALLKAGLRLGYVAADVVVTKDVVSPKGWHSTEPRLSFQQRFFAGPEFGMVYKNSRLGALHLDLSPGVVVAMQDGQTKPGFGFEVDLNYNVMNTGIVASLGHKSCNVGPDIMSAMAFGLGYMF